ncbi:MAG: hypothetical protein MJ053_07600, partial [Elusimicrobiaceae bacterium]|nr:hypothetical protein [Elusimicrobiaceae bacterium]
MKKYLLLLVCVVSISPLYAQGREVVDGTVKAGNSLAQQVGRQLTEQTLHAAKVPNAVLAQISNLPGKPLVQVRMEAPLSSLMQMMPARVLLPSQLYNAINPGQYLSLPTALTGTHRPVYPGMRLR